MHTVGYTRITAQPCSDRQTSAKSPAALVVYDLGEQQDVTNFMRVHGARCVRQVHFYREWPGRSPTVNVSWFIAKAYLANIYYTQRQYEATLETCTEIVKVFTLSIANEQFAESTFPVLLSTQ